MKILFVVFLLLVTGVTMIILRDKSSNKIISSSISENGNFKYAPKTITLNMLAKANFNPKNPQPTLYFWATNTPLSLIKIESSGKVITLTLPILDIGKYEIRYGSESIYFTINKKSMYIGKSVEDCTNLAKLAAYSCLEIYFQEKVLKEKSSLNAINELTELGKSDPKLRGTDCHMWAHVIGYTQAMLSYQNYTKGFNSGSNSCQSGYVHGLVEGYSVVKNKEALKNMLPTFCQDFDPSFASNPGACLHSLGHMTWFRSAGDLKSALALCSYAGNTKYGTYTAKGFCASGVAMNWAYTYLRATPSEKLLLSYNNPEPTSVCFNLSDIDLREGCYGFITAVWGGSIKELEHMADICNSLPVRESNSCWLNLGSVQSIQSFSRQLPAIKFCAKAKLNSSFWLCENNVVEEFAHILLKPGTAATICSTVPKTTPNYAIECSKLATLESFNLKNAKDINHQIASVNNV